MLGTLLVALGVLVPILFLVYNQMQANTPSLRWKKLAPMLKLAYVAEPVGMQGQWNGKPVSIMALGNGVTVAAQVRPPSRMTLEVGPKDIVTQRAGMVVPDAVVTQNAPFDERLLARCSERAEGAAIFDAAFCQRILAQPHVDIIAAGDNVRWLLPSANDPDQLEQVLDIVTVLATEMERFPK